MRRGRSPHHAAVTLAQLHALAGEFLRENNLRATLGEAVNLLARNGLTAAHEAAGTPAYRVAA